MPLVYMLFNCITDHMWLLIGENTKTLIRIGAVRRPHYTLYVAIL